MSPSAIKAAQANVAKATGLSGAGTPNHIAIQWALGSDSDPAITRPIAQLREWRRLWLEADSDQRKEINKVWMKNHIILKDKDRWREVVGPLSATMATLLDLGWFPVHPSRWMSQDRNNCFHLTQCESHFSTFLVTIRHQLIAKQWKISPLDVSGEYPTILTPQSVEVLEGAKQAHRKLLREGLPDAARALTSVVLNRSWPNSRKAAAFGTTPLCGRCGKEEETPTHRFWKCSCNNGLHELVDKANRLGREARRQDEASNPVWNRAIIAADQLPHIQPPGEKVCWMTPNWAEVVADPALRSRQTGAAASLRIIQHFEGREVGQRQGAPTATADMRWHSSM